MILDVIWQDFDCLTRFVLFTLLGDSPCFCPMDSVLEALFCAYENETHPEFILDHVCNVVLTAEYEYMRLFPFPDGN